jgi:hypothetical protein
MEERWVIKVLEIPKQQSGNLWGDDESLFEI